MWWAAGRRWEPLNPCLTNAPPPRVTQLCYVSSFESRDKGVLIQLAQEQLGHFPLGLFDEAMRNPEPQL